MVDRSKDDQFTEFYNATYRRTFSAVHALTGNLSAAEDGTNDAYESAWKHWDRVGSFESPQAWVIRVAKNRSKDRFRRFKTHLRFMSVARIEVVVPEPSADSIVVMAALAAISPEIREVLVLRYMADLTLSGTAEFVGRPEGTVKDWLTRGRALLRVQLGPVFETTQKEIDNA